MTAFDLNKLSIRQLQLYAAVCLRIYCNSRGISHAAIDELISHLFDLSIAKSLPDWEQRGLKLEIIGRGEPIPESVMAIVPDSDRRSFSELVEYSVEVGIVDIYGATTELPYKFACECLSILEGTGISKPSLEPVCRLGVEEDEWGDAYRSDEIDQVLQEYGITVTWP